MKLKKSEIETGYKNSKGNLIHFIDQKTPENTLELGEGIGFDPQ